jgi:hypothetical protein
MSTKTGAQIDVVLLSLQAIERIGFRMPFLGLARVLLIMHEKSMVLLSLNWCW